MAQVYISIHNKTFTKKIRLYRPPIGSDPHTVQIQPCTLNFISTRLQLKELTVAQNEVVVLVHPAIPQIDVLPVAVNDEVLTAMLVWAKNG